MNATQLTQGSDLFPGCLAKQLGQDAPERICVAGHREALSQRLTALLCSRRCPGALILQAHDLAQQWREAGTPVVSGFQSPVERECLRVLLRGTGPLVMCLARKPLTRVPSELREAISAGRLTLMTPFVDGPFRPDTRTSAHRNRIVAALAERVVVIHASPGGMVAQLCSEVFKWGVTVFALDHPTNEHLAALGVELVGPERLGGNALWPTPPPLR